MESMEIVAMQKEETGGELRRNLLMTIPEQNNKFLKGDSKESNCVLVLRLAMRLAQSEAEGGRSSSQKSVEHWYQLNFGQLKMRSIELWTTENQNN